MKEKIIKIEAPEKIVFTYTIAQTGTRIAAFTIDLIIQILFMIIVILIIMMVGVSFSSLFNPDVSENASYFAIAFLYIVIFFIQWGYYILFEVIFQGKTPGKLIFGIRVIKNNGEPIDFSTIVLRNLLRAVDSFPAFHFLGGLISIADMKSRRLGDIAAGTLVVHDIKLFRKEPDFSTNLTSSVSINSSDVLFKRLSEDELYIIRKFLNEKGKLSYEKQDQIAGELSEKINLKLGLKQENIEPIAYLEKIYRLHTYENEK